MDGLPTTEFFLVRPSDSRHRQAGDVEHWGQRPQFTRVLLCRVGEARHLFMEGTMTLQHRTDGWWIVDMPEGCDPCGPYRTKADAADDKRGLERTEKYRHERKFWTSEKRSAAK